MRPFAIRMAEAPKPEPRAGEVLVARDGRRALRRRPLHLHRQEPLCELSADRLPRDRRRGRGATAPGASGPASATRVVVEPFIGCGHCYPCRVGKRNCCANLHDHRRASRRRLRRFRRPRRSSNLHAGAGRPDATSRRAFAEPVAIGVQACRRGMVDRRGHACWCSAPGRSGWRWSRWRGRAAPRSTPPIISAERLATAADLGADAARRRRRTCSSAVLEHHQRRGHAGGHGGDRRVAGDGADDRSRRRRRAHRHPRAGQARAGRRPSRPRLHPQGDDDPRLARLASTAFPEALDLLASRQDPLSRRSPARFALGEAPGVFARLADNPMALHKAVFVRYGSLKIA